MDYEKVISLYKSKFTELDKAIATRDKIIDDLRKKVTEFRNKYYGIQNENDELTEHIESLREMNNHNVKLNQQNLAKLKADIKTNNEEHENELNKFETDKRISEEKFAKISK